jgi:hypothetical protein
VHLKPVMKEGAQEEEEAARMQLRNVGLDGKEHGGEHPEWLSESLKKTDSVSHHKTRGESKPDEGPSDHTTDAVNLEKTKSRRENSKDISSPHHQKNFKVVQPDQFDRDKVPPAPHVHLKPVMKEDTQEEEEAAKIKLRNAQIEKREIQFEKPEWANKSLRKTPHGEILKADKGIAQQKEKECNEGLIVGTAEPRFKMPSNKVGSDKNMQKVHTAKLAPNIMDANISDIGIGGVEHQNKVNGSGNKNGVGTGTPTFKSTGTQDSGKVHGKDKSNETYSGPSSKSVISSESAKTE